MNIPEQKLQQILDRLTGCAANFALYRLPWADSPILVFQESDETIILNGLDELNGRCGFVMAPFQETKAHPIVLIRPDRVTNGWKNIEKALSSIPHYATISYGQETPETAITERSKADYMKAFEQFIVPLKERRFQKLVLSHRSRYSLPDDFSPVTAFIRACNSYPRMMISLCHTPITGTWIGSTPEIILSGREQQWHTVALAGTMPTRNEIDLSEWDAKNREEQAIACRYIREIIRTFDPDLTENGPYTARAGHMIHLKTDFYFRLPDTKKLGSLLKKLHPTPAVCGLPKEETFGFISRHEGYDRSYYSGIIGWLNPDDETNLYVNLRCMNTKKEQTFLYAGGGILASSTPETEWEEITQKMNIMRNIL